MNAKIASASSAALLQVLTRVRAKSIVLALVLVASQVAPAQQFRVLYTFTNGRNGGTPSAGVTLDRVGNLYGTTASGGDLTCNAPNGCGTVFELANRNGNWILNPLYTFVGGTDGAIPESRVIAGPNGDLYGTTLNGGGTGCGGSGCGTVFKLSPPPSACRTALCPWIETVLYRFTGGSDGSLPGYGDVVFDRAGNLYGTTSGGGAYGAGTVYELTSSGGSWTESVIYSLTGQSDGAEPLGGVVFDSSGNLYGTTTRGPGFQGSVFELSPSAGGWVETTLYDFVCGSGGGEVQSGVIVDSAGDLFGDTWPTGPGCGYGNVYALAAGTFRVLYQFPPPSGGSGSGSGSTGSSLIMDSAGNLYDARLETPGPPVSAYPYGEIFELVGQVGYLPLHEFTGGSDGAYPWEGPVMDANGNLYGTASAGGNGGYGVVWEITP
ncbi:MAG TPA: choice-of-anchor tandem repeat GloVer-containing protein [Acidobacteriaceae bacterium]|nr:choice-of-anchor tandem repeat GloVer-containing protein [Acidobacteriaceae bacterium]